MQKPSAVSAVQEKRFEAAWLEHRRHLLDVAYRLLGSVSESEDAVQEAYARLLGVDLDAVQDLRGWLTTVVSRICLDQLRSARARREAYVGPWFPEPLVEGLDPLVDPAERITLDDSVRMAMLVVLEELSPAERVVFVLHEIFQFPFDDIARMVQRTPAACRQLASRARRHVSQARRNEANAVDIAEQRRVTERFIAAASTGELAPLLKVLDPKVAGWADLGGRPDTPPEPLVGREIVAPRLLRTFAGLSLSPVMVNGEPGVIGLRQGVVVAVITLATENGRVTLIRAVADPRKLRHLAPLS
jgi:RNA polymerase sigma-70 factor (ECF subfamily)